MATPAQKYTHMGGPQSQRLRVARWRVGVVERHERGPALAVHRVRVPREDVLLAVEEAVGHQCDESDDDELRVEGETLVVGIVASRRSNRESRLARLLRQLQQSGVLQGATQACGRRLRAALAGIQ